MIDAAETVLIKINSAEVSKESKIRRDGDVPFYVPEHLAQNVRRAEILVRQMAERDRLSKLPGYKEDKEKALKDTKPNVISMGTPRRPIFVVGMGTMWREDMQDLGRRVAEKPDPKTNPKIRKMFDIINDIDRAAELHKARKTGRSTFHISNNPLGRDK